MKKIGIKVRSHPSSEVRQVESASGRELRADALYGVGGNENIILSLESQELNIGTNFVQDIKRLVIEWLEMFFRPWHDKERARQRTSIKKRGEKRRFRRKTRYPKDRRSPSGSADRLPCVNCKRRICTQDRESGNWHFPQCKYFKNFLIWEWERIVQLVTRKRRSDLQVLHEKEKGMHNNPRRNKYRLQ